MLFGVTLQYDSENDGKDSTPMIVLTLIATFTSVWLWWVKVWSVAHHAQTGWMLSAWSTVKSRAVERSTIQFLTTFRVLLTKTWYYPRRATIVIKGCMNLFQSLLITCSAYYVRTFIYHDLSLFLKTNGVKSFFFFHTNAFSGRTCR